MRALPSDRVKRRTAFEVAITTAFVEIDINRPHICRCDTKFGSKCHDRALQSATNDEDLTAGLLQGCHRSARAFDLGFDVALPEPAQRLPVRAQDL